MRVIASFVLAALFLVSCSRGSTLPVDTPGRLAGVVTAHTSGGGDPSPLAGATVGLYRQRVSVGGPVQQNPPQPVATTKTNAMGLFRFRGIPAGRWFLSVLDEAGQGRWVRYDPATGSVVSLSVCTDCPIPLVGA